MLRIMYNYKMESIFDFSSVWKSLLLGQLLSLLLCTMSVLSELLIDTYDTKIPTGKWILICVTTDRFKRKNHLDIKQL